MENPKCANCNEKHVASFRGCVVAIAAHENRAKQLNKNKNSTVKNTGKPSSLPAEKDFPALPSSKGKKKKKNKKKVTPSQPPSSGADHGVAYSQVLKGKPKSSQNCDLNLQTILAQILSKLELLETKYDNLSLRLESIDKARPKRVQVAAPSSPSKR